MQKISMENKHRMTLILNLKVWCNEAHEAHKKMCKKCQAKF